MIDRPSTILVVATAAVTGVLSCSWYLCHKWRPKELHIKIQCCCGQVQFQVNSKAPIHLICYCDDCQNFVNWVEQQQTNPSRSSALDRNGGVRCCQVFRTDIKLIRGKQHLQVTVLDPQKAPPHPWQLLRAHASCCHTPIISASWRELPIVGFFVSNVLIENDDQANHRLTPRHGVWGHEEPILPPVDYCLNTKWAYNDKVEGHPSFPPTFLMRNLWRFFVVGDRKAPHPFPLPVPAQLRPV